MRTAATSSSSPSAAARDAIQANDYSVIFLGLMMPRRNGYEVIELLRRTGKRPAVIVATAMHSHALLDSDVVHLVLRKPFDVDMVGTLIAEAARIIRPATRL